MLKRVGYLPSMLVLGMLLITGLAGVGCGGSGAVVGATLGAAPTNSTAVFAAGTTQPLAAAVIGSSGGGVKAPATSSLAGVTVSFPPGALSTDTRITLSSNSGTLTPREGAASGTVLELSTDGATTFQAPVSIIIPAQPGTIPVPYYIDNTGNVHPARLTILDRGNNRAVFESYHASRFTWILQAIGQQTDTVATPFVPDSDGFQVSNSTTPFDTEGECAGMANFVVWYFENHRAEAPLYGRFMNPVGKSLLGVDISAQSVIAAHAHAAFQNYSIAFLGQSALGVISDVLPTLDPLQLAPGVGDDSTFLLVRNVLQNTGRPVVLSLSQGLLTFTSHAGHAVVAYGSTANSLLTGTPARKA